MLAWLVPFFQDHPRPATFLALMAIALDGLDAETLRAMIRLREHWADRPDLWLVRSVGQATQIAAGFGRARNGAAALTWRLAHRICSARGEYPAEYMIDDDWVVAWHRLARTAPGYLRFTEYLGIVVDQLPDCALRSGMAEAAMHWGASDHAPARLAPRLVDPRDGSVLLLPTHAVRPNELHATPSHQRATTPCQTIN